MRIGTAVVVAGLFAAAAQGQEQGQEQGQQQTQAQPPEGTSSADAFNIPDNITILGEDNPNVRRATAMVNGKIITGTEVNERVALVIAANEPSRRPKSCSACACRCSAT